jgi:hypothetical protein
MKHTGDDVTVDISLKGFFASLFCIQTLFCIQSKMPGCGAAVYRMNQQA